MGKIFAVVSGKGGVGKTTSAINIGFSLNSIGHEVIIVDTNFTTPNIGLHLGSPVVPVNLNHIMFNKADLEEAIYEHESGTKVLPSSLSLSDIRNIEPSKLIPIVNKLKKISDFVILDCPAGLGEDTRSAIKASDEVIIITNPEMSSITDALRTIKLAEQMKKDIRGCIVTRHQTKKWEMQLPSIQDMLEVPIIGVIPEDESVKKSQQMKNAVIHTHPKSKASKAYKNVVRVILGEEIEDVYKIKKTRLIKRIFWKIKRQ